MKFVAIMTFNVSTCRIMRFVVIMACNISTCRIMRFVVIIACNASTWYQFLDISARTLSLLEFVPGVWLFCVPWGGHGRARYTQVGEI